MSELDVTIDLKQIQAPSLTSVEYGKNIKEQFENINSNFRRVANADFVSGKKGSSIYYDNLPLMMFNNDGYDFTDLGKRMIEDIANVSINWNSDDINCDWDYTRHDFTDDFYNRNLNLKYVTYQDYENVTHSITFYDYIKTNINITVLYTLKDTEDVTGNTIDDDHNRDYICSPQIYTFLDQRYANTEEQGGINSARFEGREDVSCLLILNYIDILDSDDTVVEQDVAQFKRSNLFPTLYYDSNDSVFKWKLYGQETGIRANGPKGDPGAVGTVWIVRLEDAENTDQLTPNTPNPILQEINGVAITSVAVINDDSSWSWVSIDDVDPKPLPGDTCIALKLYSDTDNSDDSSLNEAFVSPIFVQGNTYYVSTNKANAINQNISLTNFRNWLRNNIGGIFIHYNDETSPTTVTGAHYLYDKKHLNRHALYITPKVRDGGLNLDNPDVNDYDPNTELNIKYGQVQVKSDNIYLESSYSNQSSVPARYVSSNITVENDSISLETYNNVGPTSDNVSINLHSTGGSDDIGVYIDGATKINGPTKVLDNLRVDGVATSNVNRQPGVTLGCPIGTIVMWSGNTVPDGWLLCNGTSIRVELTSNPDDALAVKYDSSFRVVGGHTFTENDYKLLKPLANVIHGNFGTVSAGVGMIRAVTLPDLQQRFPLGAKPGSSLGIEGQATKALFRYNGNTYVLDYSTNTLSVGKIIDLNGRPQPFTSNNLTKKTPARYLKVTTVGNYDSTNHYYTGTKFSLLNNDGTTIASGTNKSISDIFSSSSVNASWGASVYTSITSGLGNKGGNSVHMLSDDEMPRHTHGYSASGNSAAAGAIIETSAGSGTTTSYETTYSGSGSVHNNIPPFLALNFIIKYM